ncbi:FecR family protein [Pedobacter panaciterrae]|uniref:FecR family protein n=1 Tax=Pedobacter panaciterrae TaxID=363849 RepID=UPI00155D999A|nr:FecR family protein [Pedobacter panaciterrae]NQX52356.1 FecR family protein [Pedobacter panaciterrae]
MSEEPEKKPIFYDRWAFRYLAIACLALIACAIGAIFYNHHPKPLKENRFAKRDIHAGSSRAILTLASGKKISLDEAPNGVLAEESGASIVRTGSGQITYAVHEKALNSDTVKNVGINNLETPLGGQYQVRLPDGTKVWLNAASKLTYPASFDPGAERKVELKGEAYFEIAQIANTPFVVFSGKQRIEVEAAQLNISSYVNDEAIKTTLLEGMGRINSDNIIKSGQQAINKKGNLEIIPANTKEAVAWKNGLFLFEDESLETIMKSISRWYNVEIIYANENAPKELFSLSVSRFDNISSTLKSLENTGFVRFKIKGRKITVLR